MKEPGEPAGFTAFDVTKSPNLEQLKGVLKLQDGTSVRALQWNEKLEHITLGFGTAKDIPAKPSSIKVFGYATDNKGVEAFVLEVNGSTTAPDGRTYHITRSLAEGRKAMESNDVIRTTAGDR